MTIRVRIAGEPEPADPLCGVTVSQLSWFCATETWNGTNPPLELTVNCCGAGAVVPVWYRNWIGPVGATLSVAMEPTVKVTLIATASMVVVLCTVIVPVYVPAAGTAAGLTPTFSGVPPVVPLSRSISSHG